MEEKWFGLNRFWGWYPVRWEGWVLLIGMVFSIATTSFTLLFNSTNLLEGLLTDFPFVALLVSLTIFVVSITGVKPAFGKKNSKNYSPDQPKSYLFLSFATLPVIFYYIFSKNVIGASLFILVFGLLYLTYTILAANHNKGS